MTDLRAKRRKLLLTTKARTVTLRANRRKLLLTTEAK
jgi:hypothetical protein